MLASQTQSLLEWDPEVADVIDKEIGRQYRSLEMIASENLTSRAVMECQGSFLTNKYAEGEIGQRYYGGTEHVDVIEKIAKERCLAAFGLDAEEWSVNVQPYSGSPANFAVLTGLLQPHDRIMGLHLAHGGHLTHGYYTPKKKITGSSRYFESLPYGIDADGVIDYDWLEKTAAIYCPRMIIMGASAYCKDYDYERFRALADKQGALLFMDMAHTAGLIASKCLKSPFEYADVVTSTTHKSLRGPRAGLIFTRNFKREADGTKVPTGFTAAVNQAVFPGLQGGPHMHTVAAIATQMKEVVTPEFSLYSQQVIRNAQRLAKGLMEKGHTCISNGTENHIVLWNLRPHGVSGGKLEALLEAVSISTNKNTVPGDTSALNPGGIRLGSGALTSRGMTEEDMDTVVGFLHRALELAKAIQASLPNDKKLLKDFKVALSGNAEVAAMKAEVEAFCIKFGLPGIPDPTLLKYAAGVPPHA